MPSNDFSTAHRQRQWRCRRDDNLEVLSLDAEGKPRRSGGREPSADAARGHHPAGLGGALTLPVVQPAELWQESGRWQEYGPELLRFKDRHERDFVIQPTSEEAITELARGELKSYRRLPVHFYQIQTKFRDERRPRFGIMRAREFVMKDGYSFHADYADLEREYRNMHDTYTRIFTRLGLKFRAVAADPGAIGGTGSHEFHVLADSGEDAIAFCPQSDYAANVELAEAVSPASRNGPSQGMAKVATPNRKTC